VPIVGTTTAALALAAVASIVGVVPVDRFGTNQVRTVPQLTLRQGLRPTRLKLWDERRGRLVTFR
jgi:hypothetical protein